MVDDTIKTLGGLDIIVANAGWTKFTTFGDLFAMTEDEWDKVSRAALWLLLMDRNWD
jgi:NAD(P)-dependent dehydrogenase (short-subunit alcohol dehydrogenase family)